MDPRLLDILPGLFLLPPITPRKPLVPLAHDLFQPRKPIHLGQTRHQLWLSQRQLIPAVDLPEVVHLSIKLDHLLHLSSLGLVPKRLGNERGGLRHDKHARLNLEDMAVPQTALLLVQGLVQVRLDHVLDADQAGAWGGAVVEKALAHILGQVAAVVVSLDDAAWVGRVDVEGVEVGADILEG